MTYTDEDDSKEEAKITYPLINIVYYGFYHVDNIYESYLKNKYSVIEMIDNTKSGSADSLKCVSIPETKTINLDEYIDKLKKFRSPLPTS